MKIFRKKKQLKNPVILQKSEDELMSEMLILQNCDVEYWNDLLFTYTFSEESLNKMIPYVDHYNIIKTQKYLSKEFLNKLDIEKELIDNYQSHK